MNCRDAAPLLAAFADGELDALQSDAVERHLSGCAACAEAQRRAALLRARLREDVPYFTASASLRARVAGLPGLAAPTQAPPAPAAAQARRQRERWRWLGLGAAAGSLATAGAAALLVATANWRAQGDLADDAVAAHVRATLGGRAIEVASDERHTVRPWLSARLDYAPPVSDTAPDGFALVGGRIDRMQRAPVAALVYRYRLHTIDVFVRPATFAGAPAARTVRGFSVARAGAAGMEWIAVSDLDPVKLSGLVRSLAGRVTAMAPDGDGAASATGR